MVHLGVHNLPIANGKYRESLEETRRLIVEEVNHMPDAKMSIISLNVSKTFLVKHMLDDCNNGKMELLKGEQLEQIQDKFYELSFPNIHNLIGFFKHCLGNGYIDNIPELKSKNQYDYIQECCSLGQVLGQMVFIFKMSINGVGNGVSLVTQMQLVRDLQNAWIMFDHVKCVVGWTTIACHVYNLAYCKVITIVACDMQCEDMKAQQVMWTKLNDIMQKHVFPKLDFKGFMVDSA